MRVKPICQNFEYARDKKNRYNLFNYYKKYKCVYQRKSEKKLWDEIILIKRKYKDNQEYITVN